ncbi:MAG: hypothetical protein KKD44_24025 [Proteobacteria bacterium]|nr:hypothetical protein [Pseudomonadota bacterium]
MSQDVLDEVNGLIETWSDNPQQIKKAFIRFKDFLEHMENVSFSFKGRAGVSYSLRAKNNHQKDRDLFVMMDVIDDDPDSRWLSICFYGDLLTDPEEKGDLVPGGLAGEDGYCFDLDEWDEDDIRYIEDRLTEANRNAAK